VKLYFSSFRIENHSGKLVEILGRNKNIAVIANAMDFIVDFIIDSAT